MFFITSSKHNTPSFKNAESSLSKSGAFRFHMIPIITKLQSCRYRAFFSFGSGFEQLRQPILAGHLVTQSKSTTIVLFNRALSETC